MALSATLGAAALALTGVVAAVPAGATSTTTAQGTLVRAYAEQPDASTDHRLLTWVQTPTDAVRVPSTDTQISSVPTGSTVKVALGAKVADATSAEGGEAAHDVLAATVLAPAQTPVTPSTAASLSAASSPAPASSTAASPAGSSTTGTVHELTVVMAVPAGGTQDSTTLDQVVSEINGPVNDYWNASSGGRITLHVARAVDWMNMSAGCSDPTALWSEAAADAGWTAGPDKHLVVYLSSTPTSLTGCSAGLAEVGSGLDAGGRLYVRSTEPSVLAHEFGHNLGLMHAAEEQCDGVIEGVSSQCRETTYRDLYDVMAASWGPLGALSGFQATQLGFMDAAGRREVSASGGSGVISLAPVGASSGVRAVRLREAGGATYWVEYRAAVGRDAYLATSANWVGLKAGVVVRREGDTSAGEDATELLDATPSARAAWDSDLDVVVPVGSTIPLGTGDWHMTVREESAGAAVLDLRQGSAASADFTVTRQSGGDRYATAAAVATASYPAGAASVVVASGQDFPDALAAGPAAAAANGPLLLVPSGGDLPAAVRTALAALHPTSITVVGGKASVGDAMAAQLAAFAPVTRISGLNRYETAADVALTGPVGASGAGGARTTGGTVYLASGTSFADALAGGAAAAHTGASLLLVSDGLPAATADAVRRLAPAHLVALGGTTRVSDAVLAAAGALAPGADTARWAGDDRYGTARAVAAHADAPAGHSVVLASGLQFPDALAAAPLAGRAGTPLLLTEATCAPSDTVTAVRGYGATTATVVGGLASVSDTAAALGACP